MKISKQINLIKTMSNIHFLILKLNSWVLDNWVKNKSKRNIRKNVLLLLLSFIAKSAIIITIPKNLIEQYFIKKII